MFYLLEQFGNYEDDGFNEEDYEDGFDYFYASFTDSYELNSSVTGMKVGVEPIDTSIVCNFKALCTENELRQFDFLCNGTTCYFVSPKVHTYFQKNYPESVAFLNTKIKVSDSVIDDYKIMMFTVKDDTLYDKELSYFREGDNYKYLSGPVYYSDCLRGRPLVVNKDCQTEVLIAEDMALKLRAQGFVGLGLKEPKIIDAKK